MSVEIDGVPVDSYVYLGNQLDSKLTLTNNMVKHCSQNSQVSLYYDVSCNVQFDDNARTPRIFSHKNGVCFSQPIGIPIDDIGVEIIAMRYGIGWGERQRVSPQDFPLMLWEY